MPLLATDAPVDPPVLLAEARVACLWADPTGVTWMCTPEGLLLRDGRGAWTRIADLRGEPDRTTRSSAAFERATLVASGDGGGRDGAPERPGADDNGASDAEKRQAETGVHARIGEPIEVVPGGGREVWVRTRGGLVGFDVVTHARLEGPADELARGEVYGVVPTLDGSVWASFASLVTFRRGPDGGWTRVAGNLTLFAGATEGPVAWAAGAMSLWRLDGERWVDTKIPIKAHSAAIGRAADGAIWAVGERGAVRVAVDGTTRTVDVAATGIADDGHGSVWILGKGHVWSVEGDGLRDLPLSGMHAAAGVVDVWRRGAATWIATQAGLLRVPDVGAAATVVELTGPLSGRVIRHAPRGAGEQWIVTPDVIRVVRDDGGIVEETRRARDRAAADSLRLYAGPGGAAWGVDTNGQGPYDAARREIDRVTGESAAPSVGPDGVVWIPRAAGGLVRVEGGRAATTAWFEGKAGAIDARRGAVRAVGRIGGSVVADWDPSRGVWTPVAGIDGQISQLLLEATVNPTVDPDGTRWWPTKAGVVKETPEGAWTLLASPKELGAVRRIVRVGTTLYVHGSALFTLDRGGLYTRVETFSRRSVREIVACGDVAWVQSDGVLFRGDAAARTWTQVDVDATIYGCAAISGSAGAGGLQVKGNAWGTVDALDRVTWDRARLPPGGVGIVSAVVPDPALPGVWGAPDAAWLSTTHGLERLDLRTGALLHLPWPMRGVASLAVDAAGALWRGGYDGVERLDPRGVSTWFDLPAARKNASVSRLQVLSDGTVLASAPSLTLYAKAPSVAGFAPSLLDLSASGGLTALLEAAGQRWAWLGKGLARLEGDKPTVFLPGTVTFVTPAGDGGRWVGLEAGLAKVSPTGETERFDHVPVGRALQVVEDSRGRTWVVGTQGLAVREGDGAWQRGGRPWQNGRAAPAPVPVEVREGDAWVPTAVVPQGVMEERFRTDGAGRIEIRIDGVDFRVATTDWPRLRDEWLAREGWPKESPWGANLSALWEEADGAIRILPAGNAIGSSPPIFALDAGEPVTGAWRRVYTLDDPAEGAPFVERLPRPGGGAWLRRQGSWLTELGPDAAILRHVRVDAGSPGAIGVAPDGTLVQTSARVAAAAVGGAWRGRTVDLDPPVAVDVGAKVAGLLTRAGWVVELSERGEARSWASPLPFQTDIVAVGSRLCVVGGGVACVDPRAGTWASLGEGGVFVDGAADREALWMVGLAGPVGTLDSTGGVVCRYAGGWTCVDLPAAGTSVAPDDHGGAWVGTTRGLFHVQTDGAVTSTPVGVPVRAVAVGELVYVATDAGLLGWSTTEATARLLTEPAQGPVTQVVAGRRGAWARVGGRVYPIEG